MIDRQIGSRRGFLKLTASENTKLVAVADALEDRVTGRGLTRRRASGTTPWRPTRPSCPTKTGSTRSALSPSYVVPRPNGEPK